jgi:hypothetical protein
VVENVTEKLPFPQQTSVQLVCLRQAAQKFDGERFNPRKLNELEVRKQYD